MLWRPLLHRVALAALMTYGHAALNATSLSGTVEIDLIFPKNEVTYEPTPMMPMVWAVQNANLAATLGASISVSVQAVSHGGVDQADGASLPLTPANLTGKDVYYAYMYSMKFRWEDRVGISWNLNYGNRNCSQNIYFGDDGDDFGGTVTSFVDTKHGGEQVGDWAAAHAANCSNTENISINITGTRPFTAALATRPRTSAAFSRGDGQRLTGARRAKSR